MKAWHFINHDRKLGYGDGREVKEGVTYYVPNNDPLQLCSNGMHASVRLIDALQYAQSSVLCRVDIKGDIIKGNDKICGSSRDVLWIKDIESPLRKFTRMCALDVVHLWDAPPIVIRYLKTGDNNIRAAAWVAAWAAAGAAAGAATRDAAWAAVEVAAWDAAWAAARDAAKDRQNKRLTRLVLEFKKEKD